MIRILRLTAALALARREVRLIASTKVAWLTQFFWLCTRVS